MLTIAIPTFGREKVLVNTIQHLVRITSEEDEILVIDQTKSHQLSTDEELERLSSGGSIIHIRLEFPSITRAMNVALRRGKSDRILFLDDDIIPDKELLEAHKESGQRNPESIVAGRVLQPWHNGKADKNSDPFLFNSLEYRKVDSFMAGNVSIPRKKAICMGGFDTNFVRVAYHFEAEFSYRWKRSGGEIVYEPRALIHHLKEVQGGTRSYGDHLQTLKPDHAVGRYYYNFCRLGLKKSLLISIKELIACVATKHHLRNPIWIPLTLIAELRGITWAFSLFRSGRGLMYGEKPELLIIASHPIQYTSPIYAELSKSDHFNSNVLYLTVPDGESQSLGFNHVFEWDIPLFEGYSFESCKSVSGGGLRKGFFGVRLNRPFSEICSIINKKRPDAILLTGWHFFGLVQIFFYLRKWNIPLILRMDSNDLKRRSFLANLFYRWYARYINIGLSVGIRNQKFLEYIGVPKEHIVRCPHVIDNQFFGNGVNLSKHSQAEIRGLLGIKKSSFCFAYIGKFEKKKNPMDILLAFKNCYDKVRDKSIDLIMVGSGELEKCCTEYALLNGLPVTFTGFVNQSKICDMYAIADCIVLASNEDETWGLVVNEAMACGIPAIVSNRCGCASDLIQNGVTGYTFEYKDVAHLSDLMVKVVMQPEKTREMGIRAKELINQKYNIKLAREGIEKGMAMLYGK